ncbi:MAG: methyltransferase domain-containing protein [Methyloceanibacter sp.]|nr:methyltransferase domain-containing protein [Methyloceanibacter sp.]
MQRLRPSLNAVWQGIGAQLRNPSGLWGRTTGGVMAFANAKPNTLAVAALSLRDGESLLELGCGPGRALQGLLRLPHLARVIGLDWSEVMLAQASRRNRLAVEAGRLVLVRGDFARLPFVDELADAVLAVNVVYFMYGSAAVREARRVLRPGGRMVLYATDRSAMRRWPFSGRHTHRLFDNNRLTALLIDAGFAAECIRIEGVDAGFGIKGLLAVAQKEKGSSPTGAASRWVMQ